MREAAIYNLITADKLYVHFPDGGKWTRGWLQQELGSRVRLEWKPDAATGLIWWCIAKGKQEALTTALRGRYEGVWLIRQYSETVACTHACQTATTDKCICSCGGQFHRGGGDWQYVTEQFMVTQEIKQVVRYYEGTIDV